MDLEYFWWNNLLAELSEQKVGKGMYKQLVPRCDVAMLTVSLIWSAMKYASEVFAKINTTKAYQETTWLVI